MTSEENRAGMARFGINAGRAFGVSNAELRPLARALGRNNARATELWQSGWREARLVAAFSADPRQFSAAEARRWAADFDSWEIVDSVSALFVDAGLLDLIPDFAADEREFVRRSAFAMIAWAAVHLKREPDATFAAYLPIIRRYATDPRNFVRKAVNWALRQVGKRSAGLHAPALALARELAASDDGTARWIGKDAVRELSDPRQLERLAKKAGKRR